MKSQTFLKMKKLIDTINTDNEPNILNDMVFGSGGVKTNNMEKEFVPYEQALALKELGFDEHCFGIYYSKDGNVRKTDIEEDGYAPLYQQAFRWFREKHQLEGEVHCIRFNSKRLKGYQYAITSKNYQSFEQLGDYNTYEEAELACLIKLIEIVKTK